jgi:hypothetical protein
MYTLTSDDVDLVLIALRAQQTNNLECASLAHAIGYPDVAKGLEEESDQAERLVALFEDSDTVTIRLCHDRVDVSRD